jgi:hypothetical protein
MQSNLIPSPHIYPHSGSRSPEGRPQHGCSRSASTARSRQEPGCVRARRSYRGALNPRLSDAAARWAARGARPAG